MRHLKNDISHRMRRRPSIFSVGWFRMLLAVGLVVIIGLVVGPPVAGWFWSGVAPGPSPVVSKPPVAGPPAEIVEPTSAAAAMTPESAPASTEPSQTNSAVPEAESLTPEPAVASVNQAAKPSPAQSSGVYRVQVGAFLDHRNADRLVERLRTQKLEVVDSFIEQRRVRFRVIALPAEGTGVGALVERLRQLGFAPELMDEGAAVTGPMPLHGAVETARELRDQGIATRLKRHVGAASFRVVRVGAFGTAAEAERLRAELVAQGLEGFVVRER